MTNVEGESDAAETGPEFGRIEKMEIKDLWPNEAQDFTPWLAKHIYVLEKHLPFEFDPDSISSEERTSARPNALKLDILAQSENDDSVIIENQFGQSNHDHLGKVLTYATAFEAKVAIWIVEHPRAEHIKAVAWLNNSTLLNVYMFKIEVLKIGSSLPAPLLSLVVGPSESDGEVYASKLEKTEDQRVRKEFSRLLLDHASGQPKNPHSNCSPTTTSLIGAATGHGKTYLRYWFHKKITNVDLWIYSGEEKWNDAVFKELSSHENEIRATFGEPIDFEVTGHGRKLISRLDVGGLDDREKWDEIIKAIVQRMIKLEAATNPYLQKAVDAADAAVADAADDAAAINSGESDQ